MLTKIIIVIVIWVGVAIILGVGIGRFIKWCGRHTDRQIAKEEGLDRWR